jgi:hypothetical protein
MIGLASLITSKPNQIHSTFNEKLIPCLILSKAVVSLVWVILTLKTIKEISIFLFPTIYLLFFFSQITPLKN